MVLALLLHNRPSLWSAVYFGKFVQAIYQEKNAPSRQPDRQASWFFRR